MGSQISETDRQDGFVFRVYRYECDECQHVHEVTSGDVLGSGPSTRCVANWIEADYVIQSESRWMLTTTKAYCPKCVPAFMNR